MMTLVSETMESTVPAGIKLGAERRRGLRISQQRPVKVFEPSSARYFPGQTADISATGLRIELPAGEEQRVIQADSGHQLQRHQMDERQPDPRGGQPGHRHQQRRPDRAQHPQHPDGITQAHREHGQHRHLHRFGAAVVPVAVGVGPGIALVLAGGDLGTTMVLALVVASAAFAALLVRTRVPRPWAGSLVGVVCIAGNLVSGRVTYGLGVAFGLLALLALTVGGPPSGPGGIPRPGRWLRYGGAVVGALLAIPIAAALQLVLQEVVGPRQDAA